jgi:hypothetical protein
MNIQWRKFSHILESFPSCFHVHGGIFHCRLSYSCNALSFPNFRRFCDRIIFVQDIRSYSLWSSIIFDNILIINDDRLKTSPYAWLSLKFPIFSSKIDFSLKNWYISLF